MTKTLCLLLFIVFPFSSLADVNVPVSPSDEIYWRDGSVYIAQNNQNSDENKPPVKKEEKSEETIAPLPQPKGLVSTEKPIEGGLNVGEEKLKAPEEKKEKKAAVSEADTTRAPKEGREATPEQVKKRLVEEKGTRFMEELSIFNVPTANLRTMKCIVDDKYNLRGIVYGSELGYIHVLTADDDGNFRETWKSPPLNSPVRGVFVENLEGDGKAYIVAYTNDGNFFIFDYESHDIKYRTQEGTYKQINCMMIANLDNSPELEILFIGVKDSDIQSGGGQPAGSLIQFDSQSLFDEWTSQEKYAATDMVIGNVDSDPEMEIILNTGEILDTKFKALKWKSNIQFGSRLYLIDLDDDGILELVTEYDQSYIRIIDVDQRQEKW